MRTKWKRNALVAAMVVLVCGAAALNWRYGGGAGDTWQDAAASGPKLLGEATLVSGQNGASDSASGGTYGDSSSYGDGSSYDDGLADDGAAPYAASDYFASARLTRQQARDSAISLLQEAAEQKDADQLVANEASEGIQVLAAYTLKESQIENLVTAKGYQDCVAFMGDNSVSVVVSSGRGELTGEDVAKITDIAMAETGLPASGVKIMTAN